MKAVKGYTKDDYKRAPVVLEFPTIIDAAAYLAQKYGRSADDMISSIMNETNCDAVYFEDGTVILNELQE